MIYTLLRQYPNIMMAAGSLFCFVLTALLLWKFMDKLPADEGREFAVEGKLSRGKPRGAGLIFIIVFIVGALLFSPVNFENWIYLGLVLVEMITGYLDDRSKMPWGRLKKGLFDLAVALIMSFTYLHYNPSVIHFGTCADLIHIPVWLFYVLVVILVWVSINVTNCADGVDGLSGTLTIVTLLGFLCADNFLGKDPTANSFRFEGFRYIIVMFVMALLAYLWFNAGPSILMMGDAGSRAMGMFIAVVALKSGHPLLYIPFALVLILDGGLGLFKVTMIKLTKNKDFMKKCRTPLHDHVRKNLKTNWSNNQCVMRFAIIQAILVILTIYVFRR